MSLEDIGVCSRFARTRPYAGATCCVAPSLRRARPLRAAHEAAVSQRPASTERGVSPERSGKNRVRGCRALPRLPPFRQGMNPEFPLAASSSQTPCSRWPPPPTSCAHMMTSQPITLTDLLPGFVEAEEADVGASPRCTLGGIFSSGRGVQVRSSAGRRLRNPPICARFPPRSIQYEWRYLGARRILGHWFH